LKSLKRVLVVVATAIAVVLGLVVAPANAAEAGNQCATAGIKSLVQTFRNGELIIKVFQLTYEPYACWRVYGAGDQRFDATVRVVNKNLVTGTTKTTTQAFYAVYNVSGMPYNNDHNISVEVWMDSFGVTYWGKVNLPRI
jgi:hypothetical protein